MVEQEKKKGILAAVGKYKYVLLVLLAGVACLAWPTGKVMERETASQQITEAAEGRVEELEQRLTEALTAMQGVGQVKVVLTVDRGTETVLAQDQSLSYSGDTLAPDDYDRSSETVLISGQDGVVVTQEVWPKYRGALIVCEGGGDPAVKLAVTEAVGAVTGLGSDKISVVKWQSK